MAVPLRASFAAALVAAGVAACGGDEPPPLPAGDVVPQGRSFYDEETAAAAIAAREAAEAERRAALAELAARDAADAAASAAREDEDDAGTVADADAGVEEGPDAAPQAAVDPVELEGDALLEHFDWTTDKDGYIVLSFLDMNLEGHDQELLVESLLYPEDYAGEEIEWPARIRALDGQKVALVGYMLPVLWEDTTVPHFMLVRDLLACCFGGAPQPDEFADVKMKKGGSSYWAYVPVIVRGTFRLVGLADEAGYAAGAYTIEADDTRREL